MHVLRVIRALLMLPASLNLSPALFVLDVLSDPARSTNESWETTVLVLSYIELIKDPTVIHRTSSRLYYMYIAGNYDDH